MFIFYSQRFDRTISGPYQVTLYKNIITIINIILRNDDLGYDDTYHLKN